MTNWQLEPGIGQIENSAVQSGKTSMPLYFPAGSAVHTKGPWTQILATTSFPYSAVLLACRGSQNDFGTANPAIFDIGIGAAGSEKILIPDFWVPYSRTNLPHALFNVSIPAGVRIAARSQSVSASSNTSIWLTGLGPGYYPTLSVGRVEALGAGLADTSGVAIDPGEIANTDGAWFSLGSSMFAYQHVVVTVGRNQLPSAPTGNWFSRLEIAIGSIGSEKIVLDSLYSGASSTKTGGHISWTLPMGFPSGTQFFCRARSSVTTASSRKIDVVLHGIG